MAEFVISTPNAEKRLREVLDWATEHNVRIKVDKKIISYRTALTDFVFRGLHPDIDGTILWTQ